MATPLVRHRIEDYTIWKAIFDEHAATRMASGSRDSRLFRNAADPDEIFVLFEWDDPERAHLFALSDDLQQTMARSRVVDQPDLWLLEEEDCPPV